MIKISIIIPFLNEEKTILKMLEKIINLNNFNYKKEIILVNDGSIDKSEDYIKMFLQNKYENTDIIYIKNDKNYGKGFCIKEGFKKATGDYFIIQDADLEYDPNDYSLLIDKIKKYNLDFVYGSRIKGYLKYGFKYSYISFLLGGLIVSILTSIFSLKIVSDEPTCYKLFKKELLNYLIIPEENGFEWEPAITMLLLKKGFKYGEVGIKYFPRKTTEGKKIKWTDGLKAIKTILKWYFKK